MNGETDGRFPACLRWVLWRTLCQFNRMRTFLFLAGFLACLTAVAQPGRGYSISDKKAIKYYEEALQAYDLQNFDLALLHLQAARDREEGFIEVYILQGQIFNMQGKNQKAIAVLENAQSLDPQFFPTNNYYLGELYLLEADYQNASSRFSTYLETQPQPGITRDRAMLGVASCDYAQWALQNPVPFEPINLGPAVNTEHSEYYPSMTVDEGQLLFTREIPKPNSPEGRDEDFYTATYAENAWQQANPVQEVNTPLREGAPTLAPDGQLMFFTACEVFGDYGGGRNGYGSCDLFVSTRSGDRWTSPSNLGTAINSRSWESQPSFSADGRTLYFVRGYRTASGIGKQDIFYSELQDDGSWSKATAIPGKVNTPFEEESVLIHPDGKTLYFSSNGHPGMGGLDIFVSRKQEDGSWGEPENLGYPINTAGSENSLLVSASGRLALFASDREGGQGGLDLYQFELPENVRPTPVTYTRGTVLDANSFKKLGARFELIDLETGATVVESYSDDRTGAFLVPLPVGHEYGLNVSKPGYLFYSGHFTPEATASGEPYELEVLLSKIRPDSKATLNNIFFASGKYDLLDASTAELLKLVEFMEMNPTVSVSILGHTDNVGAPADNQILSENRANAVADYLIAAGIDPDRVTSEGFGESQPVATNDTEAGRAQNRRTEFVITKI